MTKTDNIAKTL